MIEEFAKICVVGRAPVSIVLCEVGRAVDAVERVSARSGT